MSRNWTGAVPLGLVLAVSAGLVGAQDEGGSLSWRGKTAEALRADAVAGGSSQQAALGYNRAYQLDLERDYAFISSMESRGDTRSTCDLVAHRLLVVMTELLAEQTVPDPERRAALLNRFYNTALDAAELRFRGYDTVADRLEFE